MLRYKHTKKCNTHDINHKLLFILNKKCGSATIQPVEKDHHGVYPEMLDPQGSDFINN